MMRYISASIISSFNGSVCFWQKVLYNLVAYHHKKYAPVFAPPETNIAPENGPGPKRNLLCQLLILRAFVVCFREGIPDIIECFDLGG